MLISCLARWQLHVGLLGLDRPVRERALEPRCLQSLGLNPVAEPVEQTRHRHEAAWLEQLQVFDQFQHVAVEEAQRSASSKSHLVGHATVDVREGQVRQRAVLM